MADRDTWESQLIAKDMGMESTIIKMETNISANGPTIDSTAKELTFLPTVKDMRETSLMVKKKGKELTTTKMETSMSETGTTTKNMVTESTLTC